MRCPSCKSEEVVRATQLGFTVCYNCGCQELTANFLEVGDKIKRDDIGIYPCDDKELTYEETQSIKIVDTHPLLNPDSNHYNMFDGKESIEILEAIMTTKELMAWCRGNIYKYRLRLAHKDDVSKEVKKIQTYEAYYKYLEAKSENN